MEDYSDTIDKSVIEELGEINLMDYLTIKYGTDYAKEVFELIKEDVAS